MGILFRCDHCNKRLNVKLHQAGEEGLCPKCGGPILVPQESTIDPQLKRKNKKRNPGETKPNVDLTEPALVTGSRSDLATDVVQSPDASTSQRANEHQVADSTDIALQPDDWKDSNGESRSESFLLGKPENKSLSSNATDVIKSGLKKVWYVRHPRNGETGPIKGKEIEKMLEDGRIIDGCYIWREDWNDWEPAAKVFPKLVEKAENEKAKSRLFSDPNHPIPKASMKQFLDTQARRRRQLFTVVAIGAGIVTIAGLAVLLFYVF